MSILLKNFFIIEKILFIAVASFILFKQTKTKTGKIFPVFVLIINIYFISRGFFLSFLQYKAWQTSKFSKYLLPPFQKINYFLGYAFYHFFEPYLFNLAFTIIFFLFILTLNKYSKNRFFEKNEIWIATLGSLICLWPTNLFWLILSLTIGIIIHIINFIKNEKNGEKFVSLYYVWLPLSIFVIIFSSLILKLPIINELIP